MTTTVPFKTQLGQDELRSRALKLGQRHRTLLFLIDGRRPLAEVLSLAQQAGSATHHFEDLLRLGLVELPPDPTPPTALTVADRTDEAALTSVELVVPADADAVQTVPAPLVTEVPDELPQVDEALPSALMALAEDRTPTPDLQPVQSQRIESLPVDAVLVESMRVEPPPVATPAATGVTVARPAPVDEPGRPTDERLDAAVSAPARRGGSRPEAPRGEIPTLETLTSPAPRRGASSRAAIPMLDAVHDALPVPPAATAPALDIDLPLPDHHEARLLQEVRQLLTDTLRIDAPLFSARTFVRVRSAQSVRELIELVWEIQDHMSAKRRSRRELQSLQRARELLGLGNTLVDEDSRADYRD